MFLYTEGGHSIPVVDPISAADAGGVFPLLWLVIALPLLGAVVLLVGGRRTDAWGHLLGTATVVGSFVCSVVLFAGILGRPDDGRQLGVTLWTWFSAGDWRVDLGLLDRKSTRLNSSHSGESRMPSSA